MSGVDSEITLFEYNVHLNNFVADLSSPIMVKPEVSHKRTREWVAKPHMRLGDFSRLPWISAWIIGLIGVFSWGVGSYIPIMLNTT